MGLYSATYLCSGNFNGDTSVVTDKIKIDSPRLLVIIRQLQLDTAKTSEINSRLLDWKIQLEHDSNVDLFLETFETCTMDFPPTTTKRFTLIKRGLKFIKVPL